MLSAWVVSFLIAASLGTWLYRFFGRRIGNQSNTAMIGAVASGILIFFVSWSLISLID